MSNLSKLTRREFLTVTAGTLAGAALASCAPQPTPVSPTTAAVVPTQAVAAKFDWKKYNGTTIRVFVPQAGPMEPIIKPAIPEFEQATGIKVNYESGEVTQARQKVVVEMTSGTSDIDVLYISPPTEGAIFQRNKWYEPLDKYLADATLTDPAYAVNDFSSAAIALAKIDGKTIACIPTNMETLLLFYRKDLLKKAGLSVPGTLQEMEAAAKAMHSPTDGIYGIVTRAKDQEAVTVFSAYYNAYGATWLDANGKAAINSPQAVAAATFYANLCKTYGPPGVVSQGYLVTRDLFLQGKAALWTEFNTYQPNAIDPKLSTVVDTVGFAGFPKGPAGSGNFGNTLALAVASTSKKKEAAWYFVQWMTSKQMLLRVHMAGFGAARESLWTAPEFLSGPGPKYAEYYKAYQDSLKEAKDTLLPKVVNVQEARDIIGRALVGIIQGGDAKALLDKANQDFNDSIAKS